ncbi:MAG: CehA/McbA family metallohydrolase [Chloroflexota bacterium]
MSWQSPFAQPGHWFKGNLHTHTTQSDGRLSPTEAVSWYREHGYDFVAITDHWVVTQGATLTTDAGFLVLTGAELHGASYHMLTLGLNALPDREQADAPAAIAAAVRAQGALAYFAHPYWMGQTSADIAAVPEINGLEIFNSVCEMMDGLGYSFIHWDELLARGLRLTGLAVDDVHWKHGAEGQGFVIVRAAELTEPAILDALRRGAFYASTGPTISDLRVAPQADGRLALQVRCSPCEMITFHGRASSGHRFRAAAGATLDGAAWPLKADQVYLRVECRDGAGRTAWSNPVFVEDVLGPAH